MAEEIARHTSMIRTDARVCSTVYIIEDGGKRVLIDTGDGKVQGIGFEPDICILTHGHFDHTQGVKPGWKRVLLHEAEFSFPGPFIKIPENCAKNPMEPISFGSHELLFFHTPGHTDGSICVFDRKTGLLFSGDTKFADGGQGRVDLGGSQSRMEGSLALLEKIPYKLLCPGHGQIEGNLASFRANARNPGEKRLGHGELEEKR